MTQQNDRDQPPRSRGWKSSRLWLVLTVGLLGWHIWMTLSLYGSHQPWKQLLNAAPIVSGEHPLHLYHGTLGARSFLRSGTLTCYDPAFQAGYPKTPVFDSGSRPAELFLLLMGGRWSPTAYKIGIALVCLLAFLVFYDAGKSIGTGRFHGFLSVLLGSMVWWGGPCQELLREGRVDLLLAGLSAVAVIIMFLRFHRSPSVRAWLGIILIATLGWFTHPTLFLLLFPLLLIYYLSVGACHRPVWHILLACGALLPLIFNLFWLSDWIEFWWLRMPLQISDQLLPHRTPITVWNARLWVHPFDRACSLLLLATAIVGAFILNERGERVTARMLGIGMGLLMGLALGGILQEQLGRLHSANLFVPGLFFAIPLTASAMVSVLDWVLLLQKGKAMLTVAGIGLLLLLCLDTDRDQRKRFQRAAPLSIGLTLEQQEVVSLLRQHTSTQARILWEEDPENGSASRWTTLLPFLTDRSFFGGLDPNGDIEHTVGGLTGDSLGQRPLEEWTRWELERYFEKNNIGWVVCWTSGPQRLLNRKWETKSEPLVREVGTFANGKGKLYAIPRKLSYTLKGRAEWISADVNRVVLRQVEPEDGVVVLSLHYLKGLRASPGRARVERELDVNDSIPMVRIRLDAPVARLTLIWED